MVVPTLNEEARLGGLLADLARLGTLVREVVVVDGGSEDDTVAVARAGGATVLETPPGRGAQLLAGGHTAAGDWILFLHADCRLTSAAADAIRSFLERASRSEFAHFEFSLDLPGFFGRFIELGQRLRESLFGLVYGDQGLLVSRALYGRAGGHPEWNVMEDIGVVDRLRAHGGRRMRLPAALPTSARRYRREGPVRAWLRNVTLVTRFRLGTDPERLASRYPPEPPTVAREDRATVAVFAKAPVPSRVKTRLAADLGAEEAARIYRRIGTEIVDALRDGPWRTRVYVAPGTHEGLDAVRAWLGEEGVEYRPQSDGDLGARMDTAIAECLQDAPAAVVVGTDVPELDADVVRRALEALEGADVVLGPATDGGYYLIGMSRRRPELFRGIPWSTSEVLDRTRSAAERSGCSVVLLEARTDVDTVADLPERYRCG